MSTKTNTRSALRAALKQEDAALTERLPAAVTVATPPEEKTADVPAGASGRATPSVEAVAVAPAKLAKVKAAGPKTSSTNATAKAKAPKAATQPIPAPPSSDVSTTTDEESSVPARKKPTAKPEGAPAPAADLGVVSKRKSAKPAATDPDAGKKDKREKVVRDSFSMPASEHGRLKTLRVELGKAGRLASKSEVLRAGLNLLAERSAAEVTALLDALPPVAKGKRSKKH